MDKAEHASRLRAAMASRGVDRKVVADAVGVNTRTVTNWTTGTTMPDPNDRAALRTLFPAYDDPGDSVMVAIMGADLTEDRRYALLATYKRLLREQADDAASTGA